MKAMKIKYILFFVLTAFLAACTDNFEELNTDTKNPAVVSGESTFTYGQKALTDQITSTNVNLNIFKLFAQYWTETTYTDEANYDVVTRSIPDFTFREYYRGFLRDLQEASILISEATPEDPDELAAKPNKLAIIELLNVYAFQQLVDIFGDVPYEEALDIENISPAYDDAATIYADLISRAQAAVNALDPDLGSFGEADLIYEGDVASWIKFGNTLLVKLGITIADVNAAASESAIAAGLAGGVFESNDDNALFPYQPASPNYNPMYEDLVASGRKDFVIANTFVDALDTLQDPRRLSFYTFAPDTTAYIGGPYGETSPFGSYSHIADEVQAATFPGILMNYDEVLFYLAEAAARTIDVGETAENLYNSAITASFEFWDIPVDSVAAYIAKPEVAWVEAEWKQQIGTQSWIAFYTRGLEAWTQWRRLDYPILNVPPGVSSYDDIPRRMPYPVNEQTLNKANWEDASDNIGGDDITTMLFWDVNEPVLPE